MPQGPNAPYTNLDQNQVIQRVFEESNDRLRVDAQVSATIGTIECVIDAASGDNIAITSQDGTKTLTPNADGSINAKLVDNIRNQILNAADLQETFTWADFGTTTERITSIVYTSASVAGHTTTKTLTYSLVSGNYKLDNISWSTT